MRLYNVHMLKKAKPTATAEATESNRILANAMEWLMLNQCGEADIFFFSQKNEDGTTTYFFQTHCAGTLKVATNVLSGDSLAIRALKIDIVPEGE